MPPRQQATHMRPSSPTAAASSPTLDSTPLLSSPTPPPAHPTAAHLFTLVPGLHTGLLHPSLIAFAWFLWTFILPLALLLPLSYTSPHSWALRAALLSMIATGILLLVVLTLPFSSTIIRLAGTDPPHPLPFSTPPPPLPPTPPRSTTPSSSSTHTGALATTAPSTTPPSNLSLTSHDIRCTVRFTERTGHARQIVHTESLTPYQCVVVVGGDGSLHEVANGLMTRTDGAKLPIALIP